MDSEKKIIGRCPFCGGNVVKTCKGYRCENNTGEHPSCVLNINAIIGNRKMNDGEIAEFLEKRCILLDGSGCAGRGLGLRGGLPAADTHDHEQHRQRREHEQVNGRAPVSP